MTAKVTVSVPHQEEYKIIVERLDNTRLLRTEIHSGQEMDFFVNSRSAIVRIVEVKLAEPSNPW